MFDFSRAGAQCLVLVVSTLTARGATAQQPAWSIDSAARRPLTKLWETSTKARAERVACIAGRIGNDTVWITGAGPVVSSGADSLAAEGAPSLAQCGPPRWIGTVHTHVRSTDDPEPVGRFSSGDRAQMSAWVERWGRPGAFCVLYSAQAAHCEVYPWAPHREDQQAPGKH